MAAMALMAAAGVTGCGGDSTYSQATVVAAFREADEPLVVVLDPDSAPADTASFAVDGPLPDVVLAPAASEAFEYNVILYADAETAEGVVSDAPERDILFREPIAYIQRGNLVVMYRPDTGRLERVRAALSSLG